MRGRPAWYLWALLMVTSVVGPALAVKVSSDKTDRAVAQSRTESAAAAARQAAAERAAQAAAKAESRRLTCSFFALNLDVYDETPPVSPAGRNLRAKYIELYDKAGCSPPRK